MRLLKNKRGQIRIIEAFFAAVLLFSIMAVIPRTQTVKNDSAQMLSSTAHNALLSLDSGGQIGNMIKNQDWTGLRVLVQSALPVAAWFNLTVYSQNNAILNDSPICSGSPVSDNIVAVDYACASISGDYTVYLVRLQVAAVD